jgi:FkbM family methyltransferase
MIEFVEFNSEKTGIKFLSHFPTPRTVTLLISDGYTGLNLWKDKIIISPNCNYHFNAQIFSSERQFEIFDEYENEKLFSVFLKLANYPSIEKIDKLKILKSYKYNSLEQGAGFSVFEIFLNKEYESETVKIQEGDIVFDIGSNIGIFSLYSAYNLAKEIHCFEPGKEQFNAIKNNLSNKFNNLYANNLAVTKSKGTIKFYLSDFSTTSSTFAKLSGNYIEVETIDIETYANDNNITKIDYLKIDCEGGEYEIIEFMNENFLRESVDKICLEYHIFEDEDNLKLKRLVNKLHKCGFVTSKNRTMLYCKNTIL